MKNIHVLPTEKPSRLHFDHTGLFLSKNHQLSAEINSIVKGKNIYITNSEEIKKGGWVHCKDDNTIIQLKTNLSVMLANSQKEKYGFKTFYKIILTTDADLIKDGVQAIDDEFLEWFIKNPSCESVEVNKIYNDYGETDIFDLVCTPHSFKYKIIIPKEEPDYTALLQPVGTKQETLEEVAERYSEHQLKGILDNLNSKQLDELEIILKKNRKLYSEEEVLAFGKSCFYKGFEKSEKDDANCYTAFREEIGSLIGQFKKK